MDPWFVPTVEFHQKVSLPIRTYLLTLCSGVT